MKNEKSDLLLEYAATSGHLISKPVLFASAPIERKNRDVRRWKSKFRGWLKFKI